jgi:hypothetical protein
MLADATNPRNTKCDIASGESNYSSTLINDCSMVRIVSLSIPQCSHTDPAS